MRPKTIPPFLGLLVLCLLLPQPTPAAAAAGNASCLSGSCHPAQAYENQLHPEGKACNGCHQPGPGEHPRPGQKTFTTTPSPCLECHAQIQDYAYLHAPIAASDCYSCHTPHGSKKSNYLVAEGKNICYSCHDQVSSTGDLVFHGELQKENCKTCHTIHGSDYPHLLRAAYSTEYFNSYNEEKYELCFKCHKVDLLLDENTSFNTNFRDGTRNLHYLHVNRSNQGRACKFCHEIHAGRLPRLIREAVTFGGWRMPIGFHPSESGGSCTPGCHRPQSYDRQKK